MATELPELIQFDFSHYNEKVRWGLDWKGVPHTRRSLLPGPHMRVAKKISGQTEVPILCSGGEVIAGSAEILDHLETRHPAPALYPEDPEQRATALALQADFDTHLGPAVRRALFFDALQEPAYLAEMFGIHKSPLQRAAYRASLPLVAPIMRRQMNINETGAAAGRHITREYLDRVVKEAGPDGYLVGNSFSIADLAAASLLMITCYPDEHQPRPPEPMAAPMTAWLARWEDHPGIAWVRNMYRLHRPPSRAVGAA